MKVSLNWLKEYIDIDMGVDDLCGILTSIGLEVAGYEKIESIRGGLRGLVVGEVLTCAPHPDSDHLHVTTVNLGDGRPTPIVCGAPNVAAGQKVVVATIGTVLYDGDKEVVIKKSKIRGEESEGMICAEDEIGVGNDHAGIIVLPASTRVGMTAAEYYGVTTDYVIEIDITPNRADGTSHIGVARDLATYLKQTRDIDYRMPAVNQFKPDCHTAGTTIEVARPEACIRYAGVCIEGVTVKESPEWLRTRLKAIGLNPINNIVDVTNFILFEFGQPLHSFDKDKIKGNKVVVRSFPTGTPFVTLDGVERKLDENDLMICNAEEPMCIAGVFGGLASGISDSTVNVFLESACFDPVFVRKTARRHGLSTDASFRFERGTDPNIVVYALKRAAMLIKELAGGQITSDIIDVYPNPVQDFEVEVQYSHIDRLIGKSIGHDVIQKILRALEIKIVREDDGKLLLHVPPYRVDVRREADVVEDILRIYGFNNVEVPDKVNATLSYSQKPDDYAVKNTIGNMLAANGFNEIMNNSLTKAVYYEEMETYKAENSVMLFNPLSSDLNAMRQTLLFGGLETIAYNINRKNMRLRLFEFGKAYTFHKKEGENHLKQYSEEDRLALFVSGGKNADSWNGKETPSDFFTVKAYAEMVLQRMGLNPDFLTVTETSSDVFREGLDYTQNGRHLVSLGVVAGKLKKKFDIDQEVFYAEFSWKNLLDTLKKHEIAFQPLPKFPAVKRDLALLLDKNVSFQEVRDIAMRTEKGVLKSVGLFDVYEGEKLGAGKKSYAVTFTLQDDEKTLTDKQIDKIMNKLMGAYQHLLHAEIR